jgi:broad specificity phosphatase PhoE
MFDNPREPTDETMAAVARRMNRFLSRAIGAAAANGWSEIVCVSHAAPIGILRTSLEGMPLVVSSLRGPREPDKGSVTSLTFHQDQLVTMRYETVGAAAVATVPS